MARKHLIASVPPVRILNRIGVQVPAVVIPVDVDSAKDKGILARETVFATTHRMLSGLYFIRDIKVRQLPAPILVFF